MNPYQLKTYVIKSGDTIASIAKHFHLTVQEILNVNPNINPNNLLPGTLIALPPGPMPARQPSAPHYLSINQLFRKLWEQHIIWTRLAIQAIAENRRDTNLVLQRLLRNPKDFAAALKPYYGEIVANQFDQLLTEHLTLAADLVKAAKQNNQTEFQTIDQKWHQNASSFAKFLHSINPFWEEAHWTSMMNDHLQLVTQEAVDFLHQNDAHSISAFDAMEAQALAMADLLSEGIYHQFLAPSSYLR